MFLHRTPPAKPYCRAGLRCAKAMIRIDSVGHRPTKMREPMAQWKDDSHGAETLGHLQSRFGTSSRRILCTKSSQPRPDDSRMKKRRLRRRMAHLDIWPAIPVLRYVPRG